MGAGTGSREMAPIKGRVKWFDPTRGFGFLVSNEVDGDILLHFSVLREHGRRSVPEGAIIEFVLLRHERGLQAERVHSIDLSAALPARPRSPQSPRKQAERKQLFETAGAFEPVQVERFNLVTGYGFVSRDGQDEDIFLHMDIVRQAGMDHLEMGQALEVRVATGARGLTAVEIRAPIHS